MTDEEFADFHEEMDEQREDALQALAEDFGGNPDDYRVGDRTDHSDTADADREPADSD